MDQIDKRILEALAANSRATASRSASWWTSRCRFLRRIRKLEESGVIEQYAIRLNRPACGFHLLAMICVTLDSTASIEPFRKAIVEFPQVLECHHMAGDYDYLLKVLVSGTAELEDFLSHTLKGIDGVAKTNTSIVLSSIKETINRPVLK